MRWLWIDRYTDFVSGSHAIAIKNVSLAEEHVNDAAPSHPFLPPPLIIEGIAQTAGLLLAEHGQYKERIVLAKISKSIFHCLARPGDSLTYSVNILQMDSKGASISAKSHIGEKLQAQVELFFAYLYNDDHEAIAKEHFHPYDLACLTQTLCMYEVGVDANGERLQIPPIFADATDPALSL